MASGLFPLVVPAGVTSAAPFAPGQYTVVSITNPATIFGGRLHQLADPGLSITADDLTGGGAQTLVIGAGSRGHGAPKVISYGINLVERGGVGNSDRLVMLGGNIDPGAATVSAGDAVMIGWDWTMALAAQLGVGVFIGNSLTFSGTGAGVGGVIIGNNGFQIGGDNVTIGVNTISNGGESVAIGKGARSVSQSNAFGKNANAAGLRSIAIGFGTGATGNKSIGLGFFTGVTGDFGISIGQPGATNTLTGAVTIGHGSIAFFANEYAIGGDQVDGAEMKSLRLGPNTLAGYAGLTIQMPSAAAGNNVAAPPTTINAGNSTGNNVTGGNLIFQVGLAGASGGTYQAQVPIFGLYGGQKNIAMLAAGSFGAGVGVVFLGDSTTAPTVNPVAGGILYAVAGALFWLGSAGTLTPIAPA